MGKPPTKPAIVREILRLYRDRVGAVDIARAVGVGPTTVYRVLTRNGVTIREGVDTHSRFRKLDAAAQRKCVRLYGSGWDAPELGEKFGCSATTVTKFLRRAGVKMRAPGNQPKPLTAREIAKIEALYSNGINQTDIATIMKTSLPRVSRCLVNHGSKPVKATGQKHGHWRGGRVVTEAGYVNVRVATDDPMFEMTNTSGYVLEHRLIMARSLGRVLTQNETVHHVNGDKSDNRLENLELRHGKHGKGERHVCADCGSFNVVAAPLSPDA